MNLAKNFILLPFRFDSTRMAEEVESLPNQAWMAHPSRMAGNSAVALISRDGADNDSFDGAMRPTPHLERCPYIKQAMASFGEVLGRSRLMRLAPGCEVALHVDFNYHWVSRVRLHVPIVTGPQVVFQCADEQTHMAAGECWTFNSWRRHRVINGEGFDRVHLVIDTSGSARFWRLLEQLQDGSATNAHTPASEPLPFDPDARPQLLTERYNTAPVMPPGELDGLVDGIVREFEGYPGNDPALKARYRRLLEDFRKDWRVVWHRFGYRREGWPRYRELIERTRSELHPNPRALLTASNEIGINPLIMQRLLRAALAEDRFEHLIGEAVSNT